MSAKFTDHYLNSLKPDPPRYVWDTLVPSFGIYVGKRRKTFVIVRNQGSRQKIGDYPHMSLAQARQQARDILLGIQTSPSVTFSEATERYLRLREAELSKGTLREYARHLAAFRPQLEHVEDITQSQVLDHLDTIEGQSDKAHAARALKTFFNWCLQREYCRQNPMASLKMPKEPSSRDRVLTDMELRAIWFALYDFDGSPSQHRFANICRVLILTGQRFNQFASYQPSWTDMQKKTISFPALIMKNRRDHTHYFFNATALYLPNLDQYSTTVFSNMTKYMNQLRFKLNIAHFTAHDFRRTYATIASRSGVPPHLTERLLSHNQPEGKVASIYNKYRYEKELRDAAQRIEGHVIDLVNP